MGNAVVSPSLSDWYSTPLSKMGYTIDKHENTGMFMFVFHGHDDSSQKVMIKAYQYKDSLMKFKIVENAFKTLQLTKKREKSLFGIIPYLTVAILDNTAFLIRPKFETSLTEFIQFRYSTLFHCEKLWISYQLIKTVQILHSNGFYHGDIKPSNAFILSSFQVFLTDLAPFKPPSIPLNKPMLFYHFFANNSDTACYLAPERFTNPNDPNPQIDLQKADLFSLGCTIAFLFLGGEHLFNITSIHQIPNYEKLKLAVGNDDLFELIQNLLSPNPSDRDPTPYMKKVFSPLFQELYSFFYQVIPMSAFEPFTGLEYLYRVIQSPDLGYRIIIFDVLADYMLKFSQQSHVLLIMDFLVSRLSPALDVEFRVTRLLPYVVATMWKSVLIFEHSLNAIVEIFSGIDKLPIQYLCIFNSYLRGQLMLVIDKNNSSRVLVAMAHFLPKIISQMIRLKAPDIHHFITRFSVVCSTNSIEVFRALCRELKEQSFHVFDEFLLMLLTAFNQEDNAFKLELYDLFIFHYKRNSAKKMAKHWTHNNIVSISLEIIQHNNSNDLLGKVLEFVLLLLELGLLNRYDILCVSDAVFRASNSDEITVRFFGCRVVKYYEYFSDVHFLVTRNKTPALGAKNTLPVSTYHACNEPLISLEPKKDISPRFVASTILRHSINNSPVKPLLLANVGVNNTILTVDNFSGVHTLVLPSENHLDIFEKQSFTVHDKVTAISASPEQFILGYESGVIHSMQYYGGAPTVIFEGEKVLQIEKIDSNCIFTSHLGGKVNLFDTRTNNGPSASFKFELENPVALAKWSNNTDRFASIGFQEGSFSIVDFRMMLPVYQSVCNSVRKIIPFIQKNERKLAYCIISNHKAEIYEEPTHWLHNVIHGDGMFGFRYRDSILLTDSESCILTNYYWNKRIYHKQIGQYVANKYNFSDDPFLMSRHESLHHHEAPIISAIQAGDFYVSGDANGFLNSWKLDK